MISFLFLLSCQSDKTATPEKSQQPVNLIDYVNPFIATGGIGYGVGCAYPGAGIPFGMVKVSPDTSNEFSSSDGYYRGGGYHYDDVHIEGFSHMHLHGIGLTDYGLLAVMPTDGMSAEKTTRTGYQARFDHENETASPGRYSVDLDMASVNLTATAHTALHHYEFTASQPTLIFDVGHSLGQGVVTKGEINIMEGGQAIEGEIWLDGEMSRPFPIFFRVIVQTPPTDWGVWSGDDYQPQTNSTQAENDNVHLGAWMQFDTSTVNIRVALSNVDIEGARKNLESEHSGWDFEQEATNARQEWNAWLDDITIYGGTDEQREIFATALYHSIQMPTLFSDVDGRYRGFDGNIHTSDRAFYTDFSLWDTYRTTHPLYTLLWPDLHADLLWSLSKMSQQGNGLARWPLANNETGIMLGTSLNIVFAEAYQKGISNFEYEELYQIALDAMMRRRVLDFGNPPDLDLYEELNYYPSSIGKSVAWTQEQSIADYALGKMAESVGDTNDAEHLLARSNNWQNLYDEQVGFFHAKDIQGEFEEFVSESAWSDDYTEGNARQYLWLAPHAPEDLFSVLGGTEIALQRLHEMMNEMQREDGENIGLPESWYWHGNEPGLHIPWLFALAGEPSGTRKWTHWLMENRYSNQPDGLAGNDDGGTLSAWYIFAAMGFYPLAGTTRYVLGEPIFDRIEIPSLDLHITKSGSGNMQTIRIGDTDWTKPDFDHSELDDLSFILK